MLSSSDWWIIAGLGALWLGAQIIWVAPLPRQLRSGEKPTAAKGSSTAFMLFWLDQYGWIGISLALGGILAIGLGALTL